MVRNLLAILFFSLSLWAGNTVAAPKCFTFAADSTYHKLRHAGDVLKQILKSENICANILFVPSRRAEEMMKRGMVDGEFGRISYYQETVTNKIIKVPTPIYTTSGVLISHAPITSQNMSVAMMRGWVWARRVSQKIGFTNLVPVDKGVSLMDLYNQKRVQAILLMQPMISMMQLSSEPYQQKVASLDFHLWLHNKNKHHLDKIEAIIHRFVEEGGVFVREDMNEAS